MRRHSQKYDNIVNNIVGDIFLDSKNRIAEHPASKPRLQRQKKTRGNK
jgi:hypothetical protein